MQPSSNGSAKNGRALKKSRSAGGPHSVRRRIGVLAHPECSQDLGPDRRNSDSSSSLPAGQGCGDLWSLGPPNTAAAQPFIYMWLNKCRFESRRSLSGLPVTHQELIGSVPVLKPQAKEMTSPLSPPTSARRAYWGLGASLRVTSQIGARWKHEPFDKLRACSGTRPTCLV